MEPTRTGAELAVIDRIIRLAQQIVEAKQENSQFHLPDFVAEIFTKKIDEETLIVKEKNREIFRATRKKKRNGGEDAGFEPWCIKTELATNSGLVTFAAAMEQQFRRAQFNVNNRINTQDRERKQTERIQARAQVEADKAAQLQQR